ncbi:uncharacterized protein [Dysidea avara]|uniref:uncharacterized protein n=1 Tax=Dysidea avara TaxID=196820 RepID=UPI00333198AB
MDIYSDKECFVRSDGSRFTAQVLIVNFKKLFTSTSPVKILPELQPIEQDLVHAVVGLNDVCLPDLDTDPIYSTVCATGAKTIVILRSVEDVLQQRKQELASDNKKLKKSTSLSEAAAVTSTDSDPVVTGISDTFEDLYSCSSSEDDEEYSDDSTNILSKSRETFLKEAHQRRSHDLSSIDSVGVEHRVVACATFSRVSIKPGETAVQISLVAVRKHFRACGIGRYLMMNMKDYAVVGQYDVLLCYADHKAVSFFHRYGFTDNPIIAHKWRHLMDPWDNSTLMSYIAPFSGPTLSLGTNTVTAIGNMEKHLEAWLQEGFSQHYRQLSFMERLRNEIILLHAKVQSQQEVIATLTSELDHVSMEKQVIEKEFTAYRRQANQMLQQISRQQAENWDPETD